MPAELKKKDGETDESHKKRMRKWLYKCSDEEFTQVSFLVDGERPSE